MNPMSFSQRRQDAAIRRGQFHSKEGQVFRPSYIAYSWLAPGIAFSYVVSDKLRDVLPEPFDVMDHISNTMTALGFAAAGTYLGTRTASQKFFTRTEASKVRRRCVPVVMGVTAAFNALVETRWGMNFIPFLSSATPDPLDIAYPTLTAGALSMLPWKKQPAALDSSTGNRLAMERNKKQVNGQNEASAGFQNFTR